MRGDTDKQGPSDWQALVEWARRVCQYEFDLDESNVTDDWFLQECIDLAANAEVLPLSEDEIGSLLFRLPGWLGDIALNGAINGNRRIEAAETARLLFEMGSRKQSGAFVVWFWREFMRAHNSGEALKPRHLEDQAIRQLYRYLMATFREFLSSPDPDVVAGGIVGLDWIWGEEKKQILLDFLATNPGDDLRRLANDAMDSNLW